MLGYNLPHLVPHGENKDEMLAWYADRCVEYFRQNSQQGGVRENLVLLENTSLLDAHNDEPINLHVILERCAQAVEQSGIQLDANAPIEIRNSLIQVWWSPPQYCQRFALVFKECRFEWLKQEDVTFRSGLVLRHCEILHHCAFSASTFEHIFALVYCAFPPYTSFALAKVNGILGFHFCQFGKAAKFAFMIVENDGTQPTVASAILNLRNGKRMLKERYERIQEFGLPWDHESILESPLPEKAGYAEFEWCRFGDRADFTAAHFGVDVEFIKCRFGDSVKFTAAEFCGIGDFRYATFDGNGRFDEVAIHRMLDFTEAEAGLVSFNNIAGQRIEFTDCGFAGRRPTSALRVVRTTFRDNWLTRGPGGVSAIGVGLFNLLICLLCTPRILRAAGLNGFGWRRVRGFGELRVLARVSFAALFFVPLLATLWLGAKGFASHALRSSGAKLSLSQEYIDSVKRRITSGSLTEEQKLSLSSDIERLDSSVADFRNFILSHRSTAERSSWLVGNEVVESLSFLEQSFDDLKNALGRLRSGINASRLESGTITEANTSLERVSSALEAMKQKLNSMANAGFVLPRSYVESFAAALAILIAQLLYQIGAPKLIREQNLDELIRDRRSNFSETASDVKDQLRRALSDIQQRANWMFLKYHPNLVSRHGNTYWLPSNIELLFGPPSQGLYLETDKIAKVSNSNGDGESKKNDTDLAGTGKVDVVGDPSMEARRSETYRQTSVVNLTYPDTDRMAATIEEGAKAEYQLADRSSPMLSTITWLLYLFALFLVAILLLRQSLVVTQAAGFTPWQWIESIARFLGAWPQS